MERILLYTIEDAMGAISNIKSKVNLLEVIDNRLLEQIKDPAKLINGYATEILRELAKLDRFADDLWLAVEEEAEEL